MNENLLNAQDVFLGKINQICNKFGLNNIMAQLYATLYLSDKALSLNDMTERLKVSKGNASINIRALERYGAVKRVWVKGSRKDYYEAEADISKVILDRIRSMGQSRLSEMDEVINASYQALNSVDATDKEEKESIKIFRQRLDALRNLKQKAQSVFNLFNSGLMNNFLRNKGAKINYSNSRLKINT